MQPRIRNNTMRTGIGIPTSHNSIHPTLPSCGLRPKLAPNPGTKPVEYLLIAFISSFFPGQCDPTNISTGSLGGQCAIEPTGVSLVIRIGLRLMNCPAVRPCVTSVAIRKADSRPRGTAHARQRRSGLVGYPLHHWPPSPSSPGTALSRSGATCIDSCWSSLP